jgi:glycosyltransferase involved in cell wall biosynthesis
VKVSVIVSTYNRPAALERVLDGLAAQSVPPAEVVVADDGSGEPTRALLAARRGDPFALHHVWQPDEGFRLARVRNLAALRAAGDWLHFLDGDCVPRPRFVARILRLAEAGVALAGDRILLSPMLTETIERDRLPIHRWRIGRWTRERLHGGVNRLLPFAYWPLRAGRGHRATDWRLLRGANFGLRRVDLFAVNGFEEGFSGWGLEDSEFAVRLVNHGITLRSGRLALGVLHLWHRENPRGGLARNTALLDEAMRERRTRARRGLDELGRAEAAGAAGR